MKIELTPIAFVRGGRVEVEDDHWDDVSSLIELDELQFSPEALAGLDSFSHIVVTYFFHKVPLEKIEHGARHPRNNPDWPKAGIFAQRGKNRPNRLGITTCRLLRIEGLKAHVQGLDAVDGTPVLDIKPHMAGFEPRGAVREPDWARDIMASYW